MIIKNTTGNALVAGGLGTIGANSSITFTDYIGVVSDPDVFALVFDGTLVFTIDSADLTTDESIDLMQYGAFAMKMADEKPGTFSIAALASTSPNVGFVNIYGEESANLATGWLFSFGNGEVGQDIGPIVNVPTGYSCEAVKLSFSCRTALTAQINLGVNQVDQGVNYSVSVAAATKNTAEFATPLAISDGDQINFNCVSVTGTSDGAIANVLLKYTATS